jgi:hypothetical protein
VGAGALVVGGGSDDVGAGWRLVAAVAGAAVLGTGGLAVGAAEVVVADAVWTDVDFFFPPAIAPMTSSSTMTEAVTMAHRRR